MIIINLLHNLVDSLFLICDILFFLFHSFVRWFSFLCSFFYYYFLWWTRRRLIRKKREREKEREKLKNRPSLVSIWKYLLLQLIAFLWNNNRTCLKWFEKIESLDRSLTFLSSTHTTTLKKNIVIVTWMINFFAYWEKLKKNLK